MGDEDSQELPKLC